MSRERSRVKPEAIARPASASLDQPFGHAVQGCCSSHADSEAVCGVTFSGWDPGCDETFLQAVSELAAGEGFARSVKEKGGVGSRCWAMGQVTRHGAGRADVSPGGVEVECVAAAKRVRLATHDAEKYFSLGRLDIREGQWGFCWVVTVRHQLPDTQKAEEGQGERRPVEQLVERRVRGRRQSPL